MLHFLFYSFYFSDIKGRWLAADCDKCQTYPAWSRHRYIHLALTAAAEHEIDCASFSSTSSTMFLPQIPRNVLLCRRLCRAAALTETSTDSRLRLMGPMKWMSVPWKLSVIHETVQTDRTEKSVFFFSFRQAAFIVPTPNMSGRYNALSRRRGSPAKKLQSDHLDLRKCDLTKSFEQPKERECRNSPQEKTKSQSFSHRSVWQPGLTSKCALGLSVHSPKRSSFTIMALKLWDAYLLLCLFYCPAAMSRDCRVSVCETQ